MDLCSKGSGWRFCTFGIATKWFWKREELVLEFEMTHKFLGQLVESCVWRAVGGDGIITGRLSVIELVFLKSVCIISICYAQAAFSARLADVVREPHVDSNQVVQKRKELAGSCSDIQSRKQQRPPLRVSKPKGGPPFLNKRVLGRVSATHSGAVQGR